MKTLIFGCGNGGIGEQSRRLQASVRRVLNELDAEALLRLKDPRLEVMVLPESEPGVWSSVWAYFPIHRGRWIARRVRLKPRTKILLLFSTAEREPAKVFEDYLRDHLGHVLLDLRSPKARNECADAQKEWKKAKRANEAPRGPH